MILSVVKVGITSLSCGLTTLLAAWSWDQSMGPGVCTIMTMASVATIVLASAVLTMETSR